MKPCPCGTGQTYQQCCGVLLSGDKPATTPEQLMRSRYTAYSKADVDYIAATMKSPAADNFDKASARQWAGQVNWTGLQIIQSSTENTTGFVEFIATFTDNNISHQLHELSTFHLINGRWYYVDGQLFPSTL